MTLSFAISNEDASAIERVVTRAAKDHPHVSKLHLTMDLTACHANGCPLDLDALAMAADADFWHDLAGISKHLNLETGLLEDCFLPRHAISPRQSTEPDHA